MSLSTAELHCAAGTSLRTLLSNIGTTHKLWTKYSREGIPLDLADRWAERLGLHPTEVWPAWVDVVLAA